MYNKQTASKHTAAIRKDYFRNIYSGLGDTFVRGWRAYIAAGRQHEQIENLMKNSAGHHIQEKVGNFRLQYMYSDGCVPACVYSSG